MKQMPQGRRLISALKRKPMTYGDMQALCISTSPQKRVVECLAANESIVKAKNAAGLVVWRVVSATRWTA
jgi:hypothetical protein